MKGEQVQQKPEDFKAWGQNLGHEQVLTTFLSYGEVACHRQGEILRGLAAPQTTPQSGAAEIAEALIERLRKDGIPLASLLSAGD